MPSTILIVDDSRFLQRHLELVLERGGVGDRILSAADGGEAIEVLEREDVDLVLCDVMMPEVDGFEFLSRQRAELERRQIPVVMLTVEGAVESKVWCLEAGASDYLVKPFHDDELVARVKLHLQLKSLREELGQVNRELTELACRDSLTRIFNRRHFLESLGHELKRAVRHRFALVLARIDIDNFYRVNDRYGRPFGDQALARVAERLRSALRDHDLLGRYGGEEFAVAFVDARPEAALAAAERCRRLIGGEKLAVEDRLLELTISVGVAVADDPGATTADELIRKAGRALDAAKAQGRDRVVLADAL